MQLVTPSEVQSAVSTVTMTCRIVFQVSFFIFFIPFFLVNNPVSVSGIPDRIDATMEKVIEQVRAAEPQR